MYELRDSEVAPNHKSGVLLVVAATATYELQSKLLKGGSYMAVCRVLLQWLLRGILGVSPYRRVGSFVSLCAPFLGDPRTGSTVYRSRDPSRPVSWSLIKGAGEKQREPSIFGLKTLSPKRFLSLWSTCIIIMSPFEAASNVLETPIDPHIV